MPARSPYLPKYRHYKPKDLAVVRIDGKDHYLGKFGSEQSHQKYRRLIAELLTSPATAPAPNLPVHRNGSIDPTVDHLLIAYWDRHVVSYYVKDGRPTSEQDNIRQALRFLHRLFGDTPAADFGPQALKTVRQAMIDAGRCRNLINKDVNRIRGAFRWAVEHELLPLPIYQALVTVAGLRKDRTEAKEKPPVGPVSEEHIEAVLPHVSPTVATMIRVQRLTGMRPQEVILMRAVDIDMSDPTCWVYRPHRSKGEHHDRDRVVYLGARCQELLRPYLEHDPGGYMFSPRQASARLSSLARDADRLATTVYTSALPLLASGRVRYSNGLGGIGLPDRECARSAVPDERPDVILALRAAEPVEVIDVRAVRGDDDPAPFRPDRGQHVRVRDVGERPFQSGGQPLGIRSGDNLVVVRRVPAVPLAVRHVPQFLRRQHRPRRLPTEPLGDSEELMPAEVVPAEVAGWP